MTEKASNRKHILFGATAAVLLILLAVTGGFRNADRANGLAVQGLVGNTVSGEDAAMPPQLLQAWATVSPPLSKLGIPIPEGVPISTRVTGPNQSLKDDALGAVERAGYTVVHSDDGFTAGELSLVISHAPGGAMAVAAEWQPNPTLAGFVAAASEDASTDSGQEITDASAKQIAGPWWSILPPLLAVFLALFYGRALLALGSAVLLGSLLIHGEPVSAFYEMLRTYVVGAVADPFRLYIIGFTVALVGMVQVASRSGGNQGLIDLISKLAKTARSTRVATALMGLIIFFDDYANTLVVGTSARPLTDRMKISREKLAYLVDSTAAPVAGLAVISTWVGYEVGLFDAVSQDLSLGASGFEIFLAVLPTRFYCILALVFVFAIAFSSRDFGPMLKAERRAASGAPQHGATSQRLKSLLKKVSKKRDAPARWQNAAIPILVTLLAVIGGMVYSGRAALIESGAPPPELMTFDGWRAVFSNADSGVVLFVASMLGSVVAIGLALGQRILSLREAVVAWVAGGRIMLSALAILVLAWGLQGVTEDLGTSFYLVSVLEPILSPTLLPLAVFLAAGAVAFSTGTSWGTMGILIPALIPLAWVMTGDMFITLLCMGAVLDGAIFGDHCSPISDTTVMSSIAAGCDHVEHVKTQMPYAITVMIVAALLGYLAVPFGLPTVAAYVLGAGALAAVVYFVAKPIDAQPV